jgi:hypothetical protein
MSLTISSSVQIVGLTETFIFKSMLVLALNLKDVFACLNVHDFLYSFCLILKDSILNQIWVSFKVELC